VVSPGREAKTMDQPWVEANSVSSRVLYDDKYVQGSLGTRSLWFDEIGVGTTFADADPAQW
jgi:hypothetical protein